MQVVVTWDHGPLIRGILVAYLDLDFYEQWKGKNRFLTVNLSVESVGRPNIHRRIVIVIMIAWEHGVLVGAEWYPCLASFRLLGTIPISWPSLCEGVPVWHQEPILMRQVYKCVIATWNKYLRFFLINLRTNFDRVPNLLANSTASYLYIIYY